MTVTISNPPYNLKWEHPFFAQSQSRFDLGVPPENNANFAFIETALDQSDKAIFILPMGILDSGTNKEKEIRKNIIDANYLHAVIALPGNMFASTSIATCIMIFDKCKANRNVQMIDLTDNYETETREQRGQFGKQNARVYKKKFNALNKKTIELVLHILTDDPDETGISRKVTISDISEMNYCLGVKKYFEIEITEEKHRSYEDIVSDLNRIIVQKNAVKITINEKMSKSLGLYELALLFKNNKETNQAMNDSLSAFGIDLEIKKEDVMTLSKNKELKLEVKKFDELPAFISLFFNMWRQSIIMLNNEENRLLVELRDALLPDLMSGRITLSTDRAKAEAVATLVEGSVEEVAE